MTEPIIEYTETRYRWADNVRIDGPGSRISDETVAPGIFALWLKEDGTPTFCDFRCPCGCGAECQTYLANSGDSWPPPGQRWTYSKGLNGPTLTPSIRYLSGCKAHFNITDGKVVMHGDSGK